MDTPLRPCAGARVSSSKLAQALGSAKGHSAIMHLLNRGSQCLRDDDVLSFQSLPGFLEAYYGVIANKAMPREWLEWTWLG